MDESEGIPLNNQTSISGLNSQAISSYMAAAAKDLANSEQKDKELANLRAVNIQLVKEITQVKLALADSAVKIYILEKAASEAQIKTQDVNNGAPPSVTTARPGKKVSYANVAKISKKPVFTLMAKVAQPGGSVSVKQVHSLIDFENDGPPVQSLRVDKDKVSLKFRSQAELDLAKSRLVNNAEAKKLLDNIHAPSFLYPVLVKVADVNMGTYPFPSKNDTAENRKKIIESVKINLGLENPQLAGHIGSFRVLNTQVVDDSTTHLVHLGLTSRSVWVKLLEQGKINYKQVRHVVSEVDPNKEVKHCSNCQSIGHLARFCPTPEVSKCARCGGDHQVVTCVEGTTPCCANCKGPHPSSSYKCQSHIRAVKVFLAKLSK